MYPFRNGSLPANALLIAIGAAAGVGVTVLVAPLMENRSNLADRGNPPKDRASWASQRTASGKKATLADALKVADGQERTASLRAAGAAAAEKDPAKALEASNSITSEQDRLEYLRGVYSIWSESDPLAALEYSKSNLPAGLARSETIGIAVNKWSTHDPRAAWMWSDANLSGPLKERAFTDVLIGWTRRTPSAAAQWLSSTGEQSQPLINAVASTWAEQSPREAASWADSLPDKDSKLTATVAVASEWATQEPQEAADHFTEAVSEPDGAALATTIADIWGTTNPAEASEWINQLPPGPGKDEAAATLATVWAASDIQAAVEWSAGLGDERMRKQVITHIGTTWGAIEPDLALDWLQSLPSKLAADGITGAFNSWAATDAEGLRQWVDASPPTPEMDQARISLADVLAASDLGSSMNLAFQLSSDTARDNAAARYFRHWRRTDDASAQEWLTQNWSSLATTTRQRLAAEQQRAIVRR